MENLNNSDIPINPTSLCSRKSKSKVVRAFLSSTIFHFPQLFGSRTILGTYLIWTSSMGFDPICSKNNAILRAHNPF